MSRWVHITSCMSVDTCIGDHNLIDLVKATLIKAPKITGSEGDADIYVNLQSGYNYSSCDSDCEHCKYGKTAKHLKKGIIKCDAPDNYNCPQAKYQTCVVISIQGDLRDRLPSQTQKEFSKFYKFIEDNYIIRDYSLNIEGE